MNVEKVRELQKAFPFKPFRLVISNGRSLPVERPSYLAISPNGLEITYAKSEGGFEFLRVSDVQDAILDEHLLTLRRQGA